MQIKHKLIAILLVLVCCPLWAEQANDSITLRNVKIVAGADATIYAGTIIGLNQLWFKDCQWVGMHTINDNGDWLQMDKLCHATTSYHTCVFGDESMRLAGLDSKWSALYGGAFSLLFMTTIELMDGGYEGWGFSWGDMAADASGIALYTTQQLLWDEQRISLKYSFHPTEYAQYNPEELGHNLMASPFGPPSISRSCCLIPTAVSPNGSLSTSAMEQKAWSRHSPLPTSTAYVSSILLQVSIWRSCPSKTAISKLCCVHLVSSNCLCLPWNTMRPTNSSGIGSISEKSLIFAENNH